MRVVQKQSVLFFPTLFWGFTLLLRGNSQGSPQQTGHPVAPVHPASLAACCGVGWTPPKGGYSSAPDTAAARVPVLQGFVWGDQLSSWADGLMGLEVPQYFLKNLHGMPYGMKGNGSPGHWPGSPSNKFYGCCDVTSQSLRMLQGLEPHLR